MRTVDLFSGIGGFSLAAEWAWGDDLEIAAFVEIDQFCQKVLKKHWPEVPIYDDIKKIQWVVADSERKPSSKGKEQSISRPSLPSTRYSKRIELGRIDLLTGGFPCQPFSCAGKRAGTEDDRWLWPEVIRAVREIRPHYCLFENVPGILTLQDGMVFDGVCVDLENEGYEVIPLVIPACAQGAPHRRDRVWIVAHSIGAGAWSIGGEAADQGRKASEDRREGIRPTNGAACSSWASPTDRHAPDTARELFNGGGNGRLAGGREHPNGHWQEHWYEVATRFCLLDARFSNRLAGCLTFPETHGIMGFILLLRRFHYAASEEKRTEEVLRVLQEAFEEKEVQRCFRRLQSFYKPEDLWCFVHGKNDGKGKEDKSRIPKSGVEIQRGKLSEVRIRQGFEHTSQGYELEQQCSCEFDDIMFELSHEIALGDWKSNSQKAENILFNLWKNSTGERFLHEPLSALHEIWRSITDKEIGSFRRHLDKRNEHRTQKLKALGNAIVPKIAYQIFMVIKQMDKIYL